MKVMMKFLFILIFFQIPANIYASEWEEFLKLKEQYYHLDKQQFEEISCDIKTPLIKNMIEQIKKQLAPLQDKIEIKENLSSFSLTYSPLSGLKISNPEFKVNLKTKKGFADPERVNNGIRMMENGFKQQIMGMKSQLIGIFEEFFYPKKENYQNIAVTRNPKGVTVRYKRKNNEFKEFYSGNTVEVEQKTLSAVFKAKQLYEKNPVGKLILKQAHVNVSRAPGNIEMDILVEYQKVRHITFPEHINVNFRQTIQSITQNGQWTISLTNCNLN